MKSGLAILINLGIALFAVAGIYGMAKNMLAVWLGAGVAEVLLWLAWSRMKKA